MLQGKLDERRHLYDCCLPSSASQQPNCHMMLLFPGTSWNPSRQVSPAVSQPHFYTHMADSKHFSYYLALQAATLCVSSNTREQGETEYHTVPRSLGWNLGILRLCCQRFWRHESWGMGHARLSSRNIQWFFQRLRFGTSSRIHPWLPHSLWWLGLCSHLSGNHKIPHVPICPSNCTLCGPLVCQ